VPDPRSWREDLKVKETECKSSCDGGGEGGKAEIEHWKGLPSQEVPAVLGSEQKMKLKGCKERGKKVRREELTYKSGHCEFEERLCAQFSGILRVRALHYQLSQSEDKKGTQCGKSHWLPDEQRSSSVEMRDMWRDDSNK